MCLEIVGEKNLPRVLVIGREASGVGGLGDLAVNDLLQGVDALAIRADSVLRMQLVRCSGCRLSDSRLEY